MTPTHYDILGVNFDATPEQIKKAWRVKARELHPDSNPNSTSTVAFTRAKNAYEVLSDPNTRRHYDLLLVSYYVRAKNEIKNPPKRKVYRKVVKTPQQLKRERFLYLINRISFYTIITIFSIYGLYHIVRSVIEHKDDFNGYKTQEIQKHFTFARHYLNVASYDLAIDHLHQILDIDLPKFWPDAHFMLGVAYYKANNPKMAIEHFNYPETLKQDPSAIYMYLAQCYALKNDLANSIDYATLAVETSNYNQGYVMGRANLYEQFNKYNLSESDYRYCIANWPNDPEPYYLLARSLRNQNKNDSICHYVTISAKMGYFKAQQIASKYCNADSIIINQ